MDVNYNGDDPTSWLWIGDRFIVRLPGVAALLRAGDLRPGRRQRRSSSVRSACGARRTSAATVPSSSSTATPPPTSSAERPALHRCLRLGRRLDADGDVDADDGDSVRDQERRHADRRLARTRRRHDVGRVAGWSRVRDAGRERADRRASRSRGSTRRRSRTASSRPSSSTRRTRTTRS